MNPKRRGLGKGLEALLANTSLENSGGLGQPTAKTSGQQNHAAPEQIDNRQTLQQEHHKLLAEAQALLALIEQFASVIRADVQGNSSDND